MTHPFDIGRWRSVINRAATDVTATLHKPVDVICPFGFEVFRNRRFLLKTLRRFYCYLGSQDASPQTASRIEMLFADALRDRLEQEWREIASEFVVYKTRSGIRHTTRPDMHYSKNDRMISISCQASNDILFDYATYIVCAVKAICNGTLPEAKDFDHSQAARNRIFQLYLMEEVLFSSLISPLSADEDERRRRLFNQDNRIEFVLRQHSSPFATKKDWYIFQHLIQKRLCLMEKAMLGDGMADCEIIRSPGFHGSGEVSMQISKFIYKNAMDLLCSTYVEFGHFVDDDTFHGIH
jgi:hypothetical protein